MSFNKPLICERPGSKNLVVSIHGQDLKMECDTDEWDCFFGVCDSGSTLRFTFKPKERKST
jgi:hypothetical protein